MKRYLLLLLCLTLFIPEPEPANAQSGEQPTRLVVRAKAKDAKFIGTSMGGALVTVEDAETGELLAKGVTRGSTGDTGRMMNTPKTRDMDLSTPGAAKFEAVLNLERPRRVTVRATAPYAQQQSLVTTSTQLWLIPGKDITGDGVILEIPGFSIDILQPRAHDFLDEQEVTITANVVMMCGCPTSPGGTWDSSGYEIRALVRQDGETVASVPLDFAGETSLYAGTFTSEGGGSYEILVYAYDPDTGNTGVDKTTVSVAQ